MPEFMSWGIGVMDRIVKTDHLAPLNLEASKMFEHTLEAICTMHAPQDAVTAKQFTDLQHRRVMVACSLTEEDFDTLVPPIYAEILAEGCIKVAVEAVLNLCLKPDASSNNPVMIFVSPELV